jgi:hypothetical protein
VRGALVSAVLTAFCPTLLANAPLVTSDAMAALFFLLSVALVWRMLHKLTFATIFAASICVGCLALSKMSAPLIVPVIAVLCGVRILLGRPLDSIFFKKKYHISSRLRQCSLLVCSLLAVCLVAWLMIWAAFGFTFKGAQPQEAWIAIAERQGLGPGLAVWAHEQRALPDDYLYGFAYVMVMAQRRAAFLNGSYSSQGWPYFFPYTFLVKTPLPIFLMLAIAFGTAIARVRCIKLRRFAGFKRCAYKIMPLIVFMLCYGGAALTSSLNIGHRHLLPLFPVLYILAGVAGWWSRSGKRALRWGIPVIVSLLIAEILIAWPNYIAYFNVVAGGPRQAYKHLVDSSLDWGQDLYGLKKWLVDTGLDQPGAPAVYVSYFGTASIKYAGIAARLLPGFFDQDDLADPLPLLGPGVYCISATMLQCISIANTPGPVWNESYERLYGNLKSTIEQHMTADARSPLSLGSGFKHTDIGVPQEVLKAFRQVRFARLCAYLRQREPDHQIGYSILVFYLNQKDIDEALSGFFRP